MMFLWGFLAGALLVSGLPKYIQRRAHRSQWYPQPWYWFVTHRMHKTGYPDWPSVRFARRIGWMG
jgi:hypothetical protein